VTDHRGFGSFVSARRADYQAQLGMFVAMESHEGGNGAHASGVVHTCDCKHCSILGSCGDTLLGTVCRGELDAFHQRVREDIVAREMKDTEKYFTKEVMSISKHDPTWIEYWSKVHQYASLSTLDAPIPLEEVAIHWFSMGKSSTLFNSDMNRLQWSKDAEENSMWIINHCLWAMGENNVKWRASAEAKKYFRERSSSCYSSSHSSSSRSSSSRSSSSP